VSLKLTQLVLAVLFTTAAAARSQQAVSSITQSRLFTNPQTPGTTSFDANGNALPDNSATTSGDDSFGAQIILKNQERQPSFNVFGTPPHFIQTMSILRLTGRGVIFFSPPMWGRVASDDLPRARRGNIRREFHFSL